MATGRTEDAVAEARTAARLDPSSPEAALNLGWQLFLARQYPLAISQLTATLALRPGFGAARWALGVVYAETGQFDEALKELRAAPAGAPAKPLYIATLAYASARARRTAEATQLFGRLRAISGPEYVSPYDLALVALALDDAKQALELLQRAVDEHASATAWLNVDPRLDTLRSDSRFKELVKRAGL